MVDGRLIITGHKGFVGKSLVKMAKSRGFNVLFVEGDLLKSDTVSKLRESISASDVLVHLAGGFFGSDPKIVEKNTLVSLTVAKLASENPRLKIIYTSTGAVYGNSGSDPIAESTVLNPNTVYGMSKKWGEEIFDYYIPHNQRRLTIFRLPSIYGPGNEIGVIARFIKSIQENDSLSLHGTGTQCRSFLHVEDLCEAILCNANSSLVGIFNLSESIPYSISEIIKILEEQSSFNLINLPLENTLDSMILDSSCYRSLTGWVTNRSVKEYIEKQFG